MKQLFLMILLTQNGAGDLSASFVTTDTQAECQQRMMAVKGIFMSSGVDVVEGRCTKSQQMFSEFEHARSTRQQRYFYLLRFSSDVQIIPQPDWQSCFSGARKSRSREAVYCASSVQWRLN